MYLNHNYNILLFYVEKVKLENQLLSPNQHLNKQKIMQDQYSHSKRQIQLVTKRQFNILRFLDKHLNIIDLSDNPHKILNLCNSEIRQIKKETEKKLQQSIDVDTVKQLKLNIYEKTCSIMIKIEQYLHLYLLQFQDGNMIYSLKIQIKNPEKGQQEVQDIQYILIIVHLYLETIKIINYYYYYYKIEQQSNEQNIIQNLLFQFINIIIKNNYVLLSFLIQLKILIYLHLAIILWIDSIKQSKIKLLLQFISKIKKKIIQNNRRKWNNYKEDKIDRLLKQFEFQQKQHTRKKEQVYNLLHQNSKYHLDNNNVSKILCLKIHLFMVIMIQHHHFILLHQVQLNKYILQIINQQDQESIIIEYSYDINQQFHYVMEESGEISICFEVDDYSDITTFNLFYESGAEIYDQDLLAKKQHVLNLNETLETMEQLQQDISREQLLIVDRENKRKYSFTDIQTKIIGFAGITFGLLIIVATCQVIYVRRFVVYKKLA
ncbi:unnamed protein product [Paramecium primaurelia]|uniref:GOLD domain-containing protein n=1 Tax=Paramecium primaurelia TaxID=5886 RepID=A0A8S1L6F3_PARPR|nr:unnamed protein product [Paramecium primaurelia]